MTKTETVSLARKAFAVVAHFKGVDRAYDLALESEKRYRRGDFRKYHRGAASAPACAELHVVRWLAEYALHPDSIPTLADTLSLRSDVVQCAAIAQRDGQNILAALRNAGMNTSDVAALSYRDAVGTVALVDNAETPS